MLSSTKNPLGKGEVVSSILTGSTSYFTKRNNSTACKYSGCVLSGRKSTIYAQRLNSATTGRTYRETGIVIRGKSVENSMTPTGPEQRDCDDCNQPIGNAPRVTITIEDCQFVICVPCHQERLKKENRGGDGQEIN